MPFKIFVVRLADINNYISLFPGSDKSKTMDEAELNKILLRYVPNIWSKQYYLQGWDLDIKTFKATCSMFKIMKIVE